MKVMNLKFHDLKPTA